MPLNLPTLSLPSRPQRPSFRFLRRTSSRADDLEAQSPAPETCVSPLPAALSVPTSSASRVQDVNEKVDIPEQTQRPTSGEDVAPPAYGDIDNVNAQVGNEKSIPLERPLSRAPSQAPTQMPVAGERAEGEPIIQTATHDNMPTIMVLVKEDYEWARAFLKEFNYRKAVRRATARHLYKWYALLIIIITISVLVSTKHTTIVEFCRPVTERIRAWPGGWLIPIALLIIVSFPPLVGHEIIGILCGLVWGMWTGFGILAAGTFFGEVATWIAFKWMCTTRARKFERKNKLYAALTQLIREKSFTFVLILRFSAVPGHIVTAVSASAGANVWSYLAAAFLTLPKQFVITYLGTSFGTHSKKDTYISWSATILTFLGTIVAAVYVYYQMRLLFRNGRLADNLPHGDPRVPGGWADVEANGADGVGGGMRVDYEDEGHVRRSVDVIFGPHARAKALEARRRALLEQRAPARSRSLPGPMTEDEMRSWLAQLDTALMASTATPQLVLPRDGPATIAEEPEPMPYSYTQTLLLSPPVQRAPTPLVKDGTMPDLAHEHIVFDPASPTSPSAAGATASRPASGTVPAILLTPTYTPARSRADSLRGTVSLDLERPRSTDFETAAITAVKRPDMRRRGESSAALSGRSRAESRGSVLLVRPRSDSGASNVSAAAGAAGAGAVGSSNEK